MPQQIGAGRQHVTAVQGVIILVEQPLIPQHHVIRRLVADAQKHVIGDIGQPRFRQSERGPHRRTGRHALTTPPAQKIGERRARQPQFVGRAIPGGIEIRRRAEAIRLAIRQIVEQRTFMGAQAMRGAIPSRIEPGIRRPIFPGAMLRVMPQRAQPRRVNVRVAAWVPDVIEQPGRLDRANFFRQRPERGMFRRGLQQRPEFTDRHTARQFAGPFRAFDGRRHTVHKVLKRLEYRRLNGIAWRPGRSGLRLGWCHTVPRSRTPRRTVASRRSSATGRAMKSRTFHRLWLNTSVNVIKSGLYPEGYPGTRMNARSGP